MAERGGAPPDLGAIGLSEQGNRRAFGVASIADAWRAAAWVHLLFDPDRVLWSELLGSGSHQDGGRGKPAHNRLPDGNSLCLWRDFHVGRRAIVGRIW